MKSILDTIIARKPDEIAASRAQVSEAELERRIDSVPPPRDFPQALRSSEAKIQVIAEVKKASPSAGIIRADFDPVGIARAYQEAGAAAVSVLTDGPGFQGSMSDLAQVRQTIELPILRKDFLIEPYQILEARAHGADTVLLIAEVLDDQQMIELLGVARELGMEPLVEIYDPENLARVLDAGVKVVGINNRDLRTFVTTLDHTLSLVEKVPKDVTLVSESGIRTTEDIRILREAGVHAVLIGETLMRSDDIGAKLRELREA